MKKIITLLLFAGSIIPITSSAQSNILNFDGTNDYVNTGITENATTFANWTIECWVKSPNAPSAANYSGPVYGGAMGIVWNHQNGTFMGAATVGSANSTFYAASYGSLLGNTWYHLAATYDGSTLKAYKNGVLISSTVTNGGMYSNANVLALGKHPSLSNFFTGEMDEVRIWTTVRTVSEISSNMNNELLGTESGLYAYYNFNQGIPNGNNTSITSVLDQTSNANNGALTNFTMNGNVSNLIGGSPLQFTGLNFDGINDEVVTPVIGNSTTFANWTMECWVKSPSLPNGSNYSGPMYHDNMGIIWNHTNAQFRAAATVGSANSTFYAASFGSLSANTWYHLAATYDGTNLKAYTNGVLVTTTVTSGGMVNSTNTIKLGRHPSLANFLSCTMDEARIWNVVRSCSEINSAMNAELAGTETGLIAYYDFNAGTPNVTNTLAPLVDKTANANNATLTNFSLTGTTSNFVVGSARNAALNPACPFTSVGLTTINSTDNKFSVYPNPASNELFVKIESGLEISADIYSIEGKLIKSISLNEAQNQIDITDLNHGFYTLMIKAEGKTSYAKFIKE